MCMEWFTAKQYRTPNLLRLMEEHFEEPKRTLQGRLSSEQTTNLEKSTLFGAHK